MVRCYGSSVRIVCTAHLCKAYDDLQMYVGKGVHVMQQTGYTDWFQRVTRTAYYRDRMKYSERIGEGAAIVATALVVAFFLAHQLWNTGFFTSAFGPFEIALFYAAISFGVVAAAARALLGRRNWARPLEVSGMLLAVLFSAWFFAVFPFDFSHFGDVVPLSLGFLISWIPAVAVKVLLVAGAVGATAGAIYTSILFFSVRSMIRREEESEELRLMNTPFHE